MHAGALHAQREALLVSVLGHDWDISHSPLGIKAHCQESNVKLFGHCLDLQHQDVVDCSYDTVIKHKEKRITTGKSQLKGLIPMI